MPSSLAWQGAILSSSGPAFTLVPVPSSPVMKSPEPASYASRTPSSGPHYNASSFPPYSPTSASTAKKRNQAAEALRSIAGLFASCFTPPQLDASSNLDPSNSRSVSSDSGPGRILSRAAPSRSSPSHLHFHPPVGEDSYSNHADAIGEDSYSNLHRRSI
ncbi:unnamed protein product [Linum tenue]|uniref:Uncharacterized protein n=1 Tax=Linum tenue TaxID=586396 RepID=A0AAV0JFQ0_9ROSI|nr:unnamed protein product [Linum tenue]